MRFDILAEALIAKFKPSKGETIAILPGGFKPPHKGHFNALNYILEEADSGVVFIGKGERDGINANQSKQIWDIYKKYLRKPVDIQIADRTPVVSTYEFADANPNKNIIVGAGPEDERRFDYFKNNVEKYPLVKIINIPAMNDRISGTQTRRGIMNKDAKAVQNFVPTEKHGETEKVLLTSQDLKRIQQILNL